MKNSRYKKPIIIFWAYCVFWALISTAMSFIVGFGQDLTPIIPFRDYGIEIAFISILILPLSSLIGTLVGGYLFSPILLYLNVKIFRNRYQYGIYRKLDYNKFKYFSQSLFSALMAINISLLLLNPDTVFFVTRFTGPLTPVNYTITFVILLIFTFIITSLIFSPTWFLMDSGILYSNKQILNKTNKPLEIRSVGRWYEQFLKGYTGVSVLISYIEFITIFFIAVGGDLALSIVNLIIFIPFPIILVIPSIPTLIILDKIKQ
ncbi:MAG: hypothetical protein ACFE9Z_14445, partial [Promethearchaeota archaeon]